jgi:hypothetical protein
VKLFWSWQADTPGKIGRHFVRDVLSEAIDVLKSERDIIEPEREARSALHLDSDRQGVPGSLDLAATIFQKIEEAFVFVADVTLVGATPDGKKLINSNVAIEYGHAHHALGDEAILMVQNTHYGPREELPFDLRHKAGPIQFHLPPDASKEQIAAERQKLKSVLVAVLRPYLAQKAPPQAAHIEIRHTYCKAAFTEPHEIIATNGAPREDHVDYHFADQRALYLRLIPMVARASALRITELSDLAGNRAIDQLARQRYTGLHGRNRFGAIVFEPHGTATSPRSLTQAFTNGELWSITTEMFVRYQGETVIPTVNVQNIFGRVLENFVMLSEQALGNSFPVTIVVGGVGLAGCYIGTNPDGMFGPIHQPELELRRQLTNASSDAQRAIVEEFLDHLFDLAGVRR